MLSTEKRVIDEIVLQKLFEELYPEMKEIKGESRTVIYRSPESIELLEILERCHGNPEPCGKRAGDQYDDALAENEEIWRGSKV